MCCGNKRTQLSRPVPTRPAAYPPSPAGGRVTVEYAGGTGMTVVGPATGAVYRFDRPGARVEVDVRDRVWLASLRQLRPVP